MKLEKSMVEFVLDQERLWHEGGHLTTDVVLNIMSYANFLNKPLEKWMFVACDEDGKILEEPEMIKIQSSPYQCDMVWDVEEVKYYQQAKERILFEDFELDSCGYLFNKKNRYDCRFGTECLSNTTIEDLVKYNLTLTATAIKTLGL